MQKNCIVCKKNFQTENKSRKYCSVSCYRIIQKKFLNKGTFQKGQNPWNKGIKGTHFSKDTEFKKGLIPATKRCIGDITIRKCKNGNKRKFIKIGEGNLDWLEYAKFVWIKCNGLIPKGYLIHHIDRNPLNDVIYNLSLVSRAGHFYLHDIGRLGREARRKNLLKTEYPKNQ